MNESHRVQARALQRGDIIGSGETVVGVSAGARTPPGKVEVVLSGHPAKWRASGNTVRQAIWGAYTVINVQRTKD